MSLVWSDWAPSQGAFSRVVSETCTEDSSAQHWVWRSGQLFNPPSGLCMGIVGIKHIIIEVKICDNMDTFQRWHWNTVAHQFELTALPGYCLTSSTRAGVVAQLRGCDERQRIPHYSGVNQRWFYFNDAFEIVNTGNNHAGEENVLLKNTNNMCLKVGDEKDLHIYAGELTGLRSVVLLVNTDELANNITFSPMEIFGETGERDRFINVRDIYNRKDISKIEAYYNFTVSLEPHMARIFILSYLQKTDGYLNHWFLRYITMRISIAVLLYIILISKFIYRLFFSCLSRTGECCLYMCFDADGDFI